MAKRRPDWRLLGHAFGISGTAAYNQMMSLTYAGPNV
jgi:hypothetical protein